MRNRIVKIAVGTLVGVLAMTLTSARVRADGGGPGAAGVKTLLEGCKYKFNWDDQNKVGRVSFSDVKDADTDTILVYSNNDDNGYYVKMTFRIIDKGKDFAYPAAMLRHMLELSYSNPICHLELDSANGRVYATANADMTDLPPAILHDDISAVLQAGQRWAKDLKTYL